MTELETDRLLLRPYSMGDSAVIVEGLETL